MIFVSVFFVSFVSFVFFVFKPFLLFAQRVEWEPSTTAPPKMPRRVILGFVVAPLIPGLAVGCALSLLSIVDLILADIWPFSIDKAAILGVPPLVGVFLAAVFGYPTLILGVPIIILLMKRTLTGLSVYTVLGTLLSAVTWCGTAIINAATSSVSPGTGQVIQGLPKAPLSSVSLGILCLASGAIAGASFWLVVRPDKLETASFAASLRSPAT